MQPPRFGVNRRDLFRLKKSARGLRTPVSMPDTSPRAGGSGTSLDLLRASRPAMGSFFEVRLGADTPGGVELAGRALDLIDVLEQQLSIYRSDSEVSRLNAVAHLSPVEVEAGLFGLLRQAVRIGEETRGAYDVTTGALSEAWGFTRGPKKVPSPEVLADARDRTGFGHLSLDPVHSTVAFDRPGLVINLGSIGKGYAIDRAVGVIRDHWWRTPALVHGGRSSLYALGSPPGRFGDRWEVSLRNPFDPETPLGLLRLRNRGVGTSGTVFQQFESGGRIYGHILDPRSGEPANGPASVTVLAPSAAEADALSTAFYLIGPEATRDYVKDHSEVGVVFVESGPPGGPPNVSTFGLGEADYRPVTG